MKHASIIEQRRRREPVFDLPPQFTGIHDRRLGGLIVAIWTDLCCGSRPPEEATFRASLDPDWLPHIVWFDCSNGGVCVSEIGAPIVATFGLHTGPLSAETPFERALGLAALRTDRDGAPARFEGGFTRSPAAPATLLTRGVVLPLGGVDGGSACAVTTWTEPLPMADLDHLRRELWMSLTARPIAPRVSSLGWTPAPMQ